MQDPVVKQSIARGVAEIRLNRPAKRNALSRELVTQLLDAVRRVAADSSARVLVVSADGPVFCAGMDLGEMQGRAQLANAEAEWDRDAGDYRDLLVALYRLDIPTIALVQGPAIAGGFGLVLACDLVLASTEATFAMPETRRGISPAVVSPLLIHRVGEGPAMPILLTGQVVKAEEAGRLGVCHYVVAKDSLDAFCRQIVDSILAGAPGALAMTKRLVRSFAEARLMEELAAGQKVSAAARRTAEAREGLAAFLEKRKPNWQP